PPTTIRAVEPVPLPPPPVVDPNVLAAAERPLAVPLEPGGEPGEAIPPVRFTAGPARGLPPDEFLVGDGNTRQVVAQEPLPTSRRGTQPVLTDGPTDPTVPRFARAQVVRLKGIGLRGDMPQPGSPEFGKLWRALWRATVDTSREHAVVRLAGSDELAV